jgi:hypothetical protein
MTTWMISGTLGFIAGGALIWFAREPVTRWYKGAENFVGDLEDQVRSLKARLK